MIQNELYFCGKKVVELISYTKKIAHVRLYGGVDEYISRSEFESQYRLVWEYREVHI